jgi:uncharacterized protein (TIGR00288 family)
VTTAQEDARIALFIDYDNLAIGIRNAKRRFEIKPLVEALADRGRVVVRRAYADWTQYADERRALVEHNVELIDIPQRMGAVRKNAADIKMAVDVMELAMEREWVTTFVIASGDSDFTPLVTKLRELNRQVIGVGVRNSTSALLPPACDEFLFYDDLYETAGVPDPVPVPALVRPPASAPRRDDLSTFVRLLTQTLAGLERSAAGPVSASSLKRAILRRDPTFSESALGFRGFVELLRHLQDDGRVVLYEGSAQGDPAVEFPRADGQDQGFQLLAEAVKDLTGRNGGPHLSGLKNQLRKRQPNFSEKDHGYSGFLQFCKAATARGVVKMEWDDDADDYVLTVPTPRRARTAKQS